MFVKSAVSREIHIIMYIRIVLGLVPTFFLLLSKASQVMYAPYTTYNVDSIQKFYTAT